MLTALELARRRLRAAEPARVAAARAAVVDVHARVRGVVATLAAALALTVAVKDIALERRALLAAERAFARATGRLAAVVIVVAGDGERGERGEHEEQRGARCEHGAAL